MYPYSTATTINLRYSIGYHINQADHMKNINQKSKQTILSVIKCKLPHVMLLKKDISQSINFFF